MRSTAFEQAVIYRKLASLIELDINCRTEKSSEKISRNNACTTTVSLETLKSILVLCKRCKSKAMLMGRLSVDREQLNKYIHYALTQDLLTKQGRKYTATDKGLMLLELFIKLKDFFGLPQK